MMFVCWLMYMRKVCLKAQIQSFLHQLHGTLLHPFTLGCRPSCMAFSNLDRRLCWQILSNYFFDVVTATFEIHHLICLQTICSVQTMFFLHLISFCSYQLKKHSHNIFQTLFFIWSSCIQRKASKFFIWHQMSG